MEYPEMVTLGLGTILSLVLLFLLIIVMGASKDNRRDVYHRVDLTFLAFWVIIAGAAAALGFLLFAAAITGQL
jgi:small-conductance mechanosensitive channel